MACIAAMRDTSNAIYHALVSVGSARQLHHASRPSGLSASDTDNAAAM